MCLVEVIAAGPRMQYEFEQLLPGGDNPDPGDPILDAVELSNGGHPKRARALLEGLLEWDARCIDAHAHLGGLAFDEGHIQAAQAHYAAGIRIAETSLPDRFGGVLGWGWIDNRPFLRCLHGLTISAWRLERHAEAQELCEYYATRIGAKSPHAGGWPLKTLGCLSELWVHYAYCANVHQAESKSLKRFADHVSPETRAALRDPVRVMPFANLEYPPGNRKDHGIAGARGPLPKSGLTPAELALPY